MKGIIPCPYCVGEVEVIKPGKKGKEKKDTYVTYQLEKGDQYR